MLTVNQRTAVNHFFQYLDARQGKPLFVYEKAFAPVIHAIQYVAQETGRDIDLVSVEQYEPAEIYELLSSAEKFVCAFNPTFRSGVTEAVEVMSERATMLGLRAYTLSDLSAAFFDIFGTCPSEIQMLNQQLIRALQKGKQLTVTDPNGTYLEITLDESYDWVNMDGFTEIDFDLTCNLPVGEVATYSPQVEGKIYFTGSLLGTIPIGRKYGFITDPVIFDIQDSKVTRIVAQNIRLQRDLEFCLFLDDYTHYVNEVAVGTNRGIPELLGFNYKYEENQFGFHLGFGATLAQQNVERLTPHHLDLVFHHSTVHLDGKILFDGEYHLENFPHAYSDDPLRIAERTCCGMFDISNKKHAIR